MHDERRAAGVRRIDHEVHRVERDRFGFEANVRGGLGEHRAHDAGYGGAPTVAPAGRRRAVLSPAAPPKYGTYLLATTVSNNTITGPGTAPPKYLADGVFSRATLMSNSTISGNSVGENGYGAAVISGAMLAHNSTITGDHNLVRSSGGGGTLPPDTIVGRNPLLGPLADNGGIVAGAPGGSGTGHVRTHLLLDGSPAIDNGSNPDNLDFEQRGPGFPRVVGIRPNIGATEGNAQRLATAVPVLGPWALATLSALVAGLG